MLCKGLSCQNVEKVIRIVLKELVGVDVERLPKATFAKYMLLEARGLAQIHVASELSGESSQNTLHSDGTSKHGRGFTTYDISTNDGKVLVTGLREVASGDAESQLDLFKEILEDVFEVTKENDISQSVKKSFVSIKI